MKERIDYLVDYLNQRTVEYDEGHPSISDKEWDTFYFELKDLENHTNYIREDSPTQKVHFQIVSELSKSTHNHKMLSLDKTKSVAEVEEFLGTADYIGMCKMDGLTCSLRYLDGKLVSAETRGDGFVGEDILHNALVIPSIPKRIPYYDELVVDGEIICSVGDFAEFADEYKNPRNFAAGSIRLLDANECATRKLQFIAWDVIKGLDFVPNLTTKLHILQTEYYFTCVPFAIGHVAECIDKIQHAAVEFGYPIDGVVFKFNNVEYGRTLGETTHHFKNAIAYKFYDESFPTQLRAIDWTMGRTGVLTPVAVFEPIDIDGSTVERASLHNVSVMRGLWDKQWQSGLTVHIYKANQIIPQISKVEQGNLQDATDLNPPAICPVCGGATELVTSDEGIVNLVCANPDCEGKLINKLDHFCGKKGLDIKGLSKATLEKVIEWGWVGSCRDLFYLFKHSDEWVKKPGFGQKSVTKICDAIDAGRKTEMWRFISALGIPLIGSTYAKEICKKLATWEEFREKVDSSFDFTAWNGFGPEMHASLVRFDYKEADWLFEYVMELENTLQTKPGDNDGTKQTLQGMTVVITGKLTQFKNRSEMQSAIEQAGGKVGSSVTGNTKILVNNDNTSTSAKNVAAQKLGIPILTEQEFVEKYL